MVDREPQRWVRPGACADFQSTRWTLVLAAGHKSSPDSQEALAALCETYWYPLYAYVRRHGAEVHRAQDLTQDFFARLLEKNLLAVAQPERGRFRTFLLSTLKNFLCNEYDKVRAKKRGGDRLVLSLDFEAGESRYQREPAHSLTAERLFERQWALAVLDRVLAQLRAEFAGAGKEPLFDALKAFLTAGRGEASYAAAAEALGMTEGAVRVAAHRLRRRYRELLRAEVAQTVAEPDEIDDEIRRLFETLGD
jgi:RNA polymerase sigma factor (sigma-70 family)